MNIINKIINYTIENKQWIFSGIGVFVLGLPLSIFIIHQNVKNKREQRINAFIENFKKLYKGGGYKLEVLIPAGIAYLKNNKEIEIAFEQLIKSIPNHPLRSWKIRVENIGYKKFFKYVVATGKELNKVSIEEFLRYFEKP